MATQSRLLLRRLAVGLSLTVAACAIDQPSGDQPAAAEERTVELATDPALLVVGTLPLGAGDQAMKTRLENLGVGVVVKKDSTVLPGDYLQKRLVLFSSTIVNINAMPPLAPEAPVPVVSWNWRLFARLGWSANPAAGALSNQSQLEIVAAGDPLAAGLMGVQTVTTIPQAITYVGRAIPGAPVVGRITAAGYQLTASLFRIDPGTRQGSTLIGGRRVGLFLSDNTAAFLTAAGGALVDASLNWSLAPLRQPGDACAAGAECANGFCVAGICCATECAPNICTPDGNRSVAQSCGTGHCTQSNAVACGAYQCSGGICPAACTADSQCAAGYACDLPTGSCQLAGPCNPTIAEICGAYRCTRRKVCALSCATNSDCAAGAGCQANRCYPMCTASTDCIAGSLCTTGLCVPAPCASSAECGTGSFCYHGQCTPLQPCRARIDCAYELQCIAGFCRLP